MNRFRESREDGASLVMALVFLLVAGLFVAAALNKSQSVSASGQQVRQRGQLQYALDGGVDRAIQVLQDDLATGAPSRCLSAPELETDLTDLQDTVAGLPLNGHDVAYSCQTLAGRVALATDVSTTNYALLVTSPNPGALTTQSAVGDNSVLVVKGSVYLNGSVDDSDLKKKIQVSSGDVVSPSSRAGCDADLAALTHLTTSGTGQLKSCTTQTLAQAMPAVTLPPAPVVDLSAALGSGVTLNLGGNKKCRVFYPGRYSSPPVLSTSDPNYFVSGLYYFADIGTWSIEGGSQGPQVVAGTRALGTDTAVPATNCQTVTDTTALGALPAALSGLTATITAQQFSAGATWVFGGTSSIDFKRGSVTMFSPPAVSPLQPVNLVGVSETANGYEAVTPGAAVVSGGSRNSTMQLNARLYAPTAGVTVFSTNDTVAAAAGGIVAYTIDLQASAVGSETLAISAPGGTTNPPPPFRTIRIVTRDKSGTAATNTAVVTIGNFSPYPVSVKSWRTG